MVSESNVYRVLRAANQVQDGKVQGLWATSAVELRYAFLTSNIHGAFYRLHFVLVIFSRKFVDWEVLHHKSVGHVTVLIRKVFLAEGSY